LRDWIKEAELNLKHAKNSLELGFYNWACCSSKECAEKAVKAVYQKLNIDQAGDSVSNLLLEISRKFRVNKKYIEYAYELDKIFIPAKNLDIQPSHLAKDKYTEEEARIMISYAEEILNLCKNLLNKI